MDIELSPSRGEAVPGSCGRRGAVLWRGEVFPGLGVGVVDIQVTQDSCAKRVGIQLLCAHAK
jgi:hypothetical protein